MKRSFPILSYLIYIALAIWIILSLQADINALPEQGSSVGEDIGIGLSEAFGKIFMVIVGAYGAVAVVALLVKLVHIGLRFWLIGIISALFDLAFTVVHGALLYQSLSPESGIGIAIIPLMVLAILSLISFIANTMSITN